MKAPKRISLLLFSLLLASFFSASVTTNTAQAVLPNSCPFTIAVGDETERALALTELNRLRFDLYQAPALNIFEIAQYSKEAQAHANYLQNNSDDVTVDPTTEIPANPCYSNEGKTGATYGIIRPGQPWLGSKNNASNLREGVMAAVDSVYDRLYLLDPRLEALGVGIANNRSYDAKIVFNAKRFERRWLNALTPTYPLIFPEPNGLIPPQINPTVDDPGVPLQMSEGEYPNPLVSLGLNYPTGYPISVMFNPTIPVSVLVVSVKNESTGADINIKTILPGDSRYPSGLGNTITIIPTNPLTPGTTYKVNLTYQDNSFVYQRAWNFDTVKVPTLIPTTPPIITPPATPGVPGLPTPPPVSPAPVGGGFFNLVRSDATNGLFFRQWQRADDPVLLGKASRSWTFGEQPYGFLTLLEPYAGINRIVNYHDKARMEAVTSNSGSISNGLLVREMVSGFAQVGDNNFIPRTPAQIAIAGDISETNIKAPTYYSFYNIASLNNDRRIPNQTGQTVIATIAKEGVVNVNPGAAAYNVINVYYDNNLGHNIPQVFWNYMNQSGTINIGGGYTYGQIVDWLSVFGLPLTDAYWSRAVVGGVEKDVLVQLFERRVLTFTPQNPDPFKVEMGNVGRHYVKWRYNINY